MADGDPGPIPPQPSPSPSRQSLSNARVWASGRYRFAYEHLRLLASEVMILLRYRDELGGRVLDVGCGAGRLLSYLRRLGGEPIGVDLSEAMVAHCRSRFPELDVHRGDLRTLAATERGPFDAILLADNLLDVFDDRERRQVLSALRGLLGDGGLLVLSSHNLDRERIRRSEPPWRLRRRVGDYLRRILERRDGTIARSALAPLHAWRNRRALASLGFRGADHEIVNDAAHAYALAHYFIGAREMRAQLGQVGYEVLEVLEEDGAPVAPGDAGKSLTLYYVARPSVVLPSAP